MRKMGVQHQENRRLIISIAEECDVNGGQYTYSRRYKITPSLMRNRLFSRLLFSLIKIINGQKISRTAFTFKRLSESVYSSGLHRVME